MTHYVQYIINVIIGACTANPHYVWHILPPKLVGRVGRLEIWPGKIVPLLIKSELHKYEIRKSEIEVSSRRKRPSHH